MNENFKNTLKYASLAFLFGMIIFAIPTAIILIDKHHLEKNYVFEVYRENLELDYYRSKDALVDVVDSYIKEVAPSSIMNGIAFVNKCDEYNMNLFFVIAQAQVESAFATKGLGQKMNSAFNVKAYDGKGSKYMDKYHHPDESIEPYIVLIKNDYMGDSKTEMDLMDNYVNFEGKRYATNPDYESMLLSTYKKLIDRYDTVYDEYLKYKTLSGK